MPSAVELAATMAMVNANLAILVQQQAEAKDREEKEARGATVGSLISGSDFGRPLCLPGSQMCHRGEVAGKGCPIPYQGKLWPLGPGQS